MTSIKQPDNNLWNDDAGYRISSEVNGVINDIENVNNEINTRSTSVLDAINSAYQYVSKAPIIEGLSHDSH